MKIMKIILILFIAIFSNKEIFGMKDTNTLEVTFEVDAPKQSKELQNKLYLLFEKDNEPVITPSIKNKKTEAFDVGSLKNLQKITLIIANKQSETAITIAKNPKTMEEEKYAADFSLFKPGNKLKIIYKPHLGAVGEKILIKKL